MAVAVLSPAAAVLLLAALLLAVPPASAAELAAGAAAVEQGDDRLEPAAVLHLGYSDFYSTEIYYWGRQYGPVRQETAVATFVRRWGLFKSNLLSARFGLAVMDERSQLKYSQPVYAHYNQKNDAANAGADFGIVWVLPKSSALHLAFAWDSHLFAAGGEGGIFLATGRKQTLSVTTGVQF